MDIDPTSDSSERFKLYDELELQEFQDKFVIKSLQSPNEGFWISRVDGNINLLDGNLLFIYLFIYFLLNFSSFSFYDWLQMERRLILVFCEVYYCY